MLLSLLEAIGLQVSAREALITENSRAEIHRVTQSLLPEVSGDVVAILFLAHPSITAAFPAEGARLVGWVQTPLLCLQAPELAANTIQVAIVRPTAGRSWVGVRGANTVKASTESALLALFSALQQKNPSLPTTTKLILTTVTSDLEPNNAATAVQTLSWNLCILQNGFELNVSSIPKVVRVLVLAETSERPQHVFLQETAQLRPDLSPNLSPE